MTPTVVKEIVVPLTALLASHPSARQDAVWAAITAGAAEHVGQDGSVTMDNRALLAVATARVPAEQAVHSDHHLP